MCSVSVIRAVCKTENISHVIYAQLASMVKCCCFRKPEGALV